MRHHRTQHAGIRLMAHAPSATPARHTATCACKKVPVRQSAGLPFGIPFDASSNTLTASSIDIGAGNMLSQPPRPKSRHIGPPTHPATRPRPGARPQHGPLGRPSCPPTCHPQTARPSAAGR